MDPFSISVGTVSLLQLTFQLGKYLHDVYKVAATFREEIGSLLSEIQDLESINKSIEQFHRGETQIYTTGQSELSQEDIEVWQNTIRTLQNCSNTVCLRSSLLLDDTDMLHQSFRSANKVASSLPLNKHFDTPKAVSSIFTGRKTYLDGLKQAFDASHSSFDDSYLPKRFVIFGLGGSGKTQFCCKFAWENKQRFWGVFTVDASSPGNAQQSFVTIAKACGTDPNERAAKSWLSSSDRPWLLLIDNADDTNLEIEKYFPDGEQGLTLITTRNPSVKMHGTIGQRFYHFDRLDHDEANELLLRAADNREPRTPTILRLASAITRTLGALPLALVHAGKAIKAKICDLSNYVSYYERSWQLIRQSQHTTSGADDDADYMKVYASYESYFAVWKP